MRLVRWVVLLFWFGLSASALAQSAQMVMTPAGFRDQKKIHILKPNEAVRKRNGRYEIFDKTSDALVSRDDSEGTSSAVDDSGWITYGLFQVPEETIVSSFTSVWTVPAAPTHQDGQLLYLFNGLMDTAESVILQPVLQWGTSPIGGGNYWAVASWYVTDDGQAFSTEPLPVQTGQVLTGVMKNPNDDGSSWTSEFVGIDNTLLTVQSPPTLTQASETLEVYNVDSCADYPAGSTAFTGINLATSTALTTLDWGAESPTKDCGQNTVVANPSSTSGEVDLSYGTP